MSNIVVTVVIVGGLWLVVFLVTQMTIIPQHRKKVTVALETCCKLVKGAKTRKSRHYPYFKAEQELRRLMRRGQYIVGCVFFGGVSGVISSGMLGILMDTQSPVSWYESVAGVLSTVESMVILLIGFLCFGVVILWRDWRKIEQFESWLKS